MHVELDKMECVQMDKTNHRNNAQMNQMNQMNSWLDDAWIASVSGHNIMVYHIKKSYVYT